MSTLNNVNTTSVIMKGEKKMTCNTMSVDWGTIYDGQEQEAEKIIKGLYDTKNYEELHIALWTWLSLDGTREEADWFDTFGIPEVRNYCFACERAQETFWCSTKSATEDEYRPEFCSCCPITDRAEDECMAGLYGKWLGTYFEERQDVAMEIADMKWTTKLYKEDHLLIDKKIIKIG